MSKASNEANTAEILGIDDAEIATRRSLLQIGPDDEAVMSGLDAMSRERLPEWLNDIESHFRAFPEAARALAEILKRMQARKIAVVLAGMRSIEQTLALGIGLRAVPARAPAVQT